MQNAEKKKTESARAYTQKHAVCTTWANRCASVRACVNGPMCKRPQNKNCTCARGRGQWEHDMNEMSSRQGQHLCVWQTSKVRSKVSEASMNETSTSNPSKDEGLMQ